MKGIRVLTNSALALVFIILASCNGQVTEYPPPQETSTRTPASTSSPRPTYVHPTMQPANATRIARPGAEKATLTAMAQNAYVDCDGYPHVWVEDPKNFSPSGIWRIAYCQHPNTGGSYTKVINQVEGVTWEVPYLDSNGKNRPEGEDGGQMLIGAWSSNQKYAYFVRSFCCGGDGPGRELYNGYGLYRLNLNTGEILEIIGTTSFSFSADGNYLARFNRDTRKIFVENLDTEKYSSYDIYEGFDLAGMFSWSPDGSKLIFFAADQNWVELETGFAIYLIDLNNLKIKSVISNPTNYFYVQKWLSNIEVLLFAYKTDWSESEYYILNIATHELIPSDPYGIALTPKP